MEIHNYAIELDSAIMSSEKDKHNIILETHNLRKEFGGLVAVSDVSVQISSGSLHSIIGPNGAGKTTFFNLLVVNMPRQKGA